MKLTTLDKELLDGLQVLTDQEIGRVQAHLVAGLPMWWGDFRYRDGGPSPDGCLVSTCMSSSEFHARGSVWNLVHVFDLWATDRFTLSPRFSLDSQLLPQKVDRLAALLDMEWSRRHPSLLQNPPEMTGIEVDSPAETPLLQENLHAQPREISTPLEAVLSA